MAPAREKDEARSYGYIDEKGRYAIEPRFDTAFPFENGAARVRIYGRFERGAEAYIDPTGAFLWTPSE